MRSGLVNEKSLQTTVPESLTVLCTRGQAGRNPGTQHLVDLG